MRELLRRTNAYAAIAGDRSAPHATLVLFPDGKYLRALLKECAKAFFKAQDGSRIERLIETESFADCLFLPAEGEKLTAADGAHIIDESLLRPVEGDKKLFVLDGFHTVTPIVQNKLLKVLEEPPAGVYFLLGATAEHTVLPTVLSRVRKLAVPPFPEEAVFAALGRNYTGDPGIGEASAACGGVYSVAESLLEGGGEDFRLAEEFLRGENVERLCRELGDRKEKRSFFAAVRLTARDMLFYRTGGKKYVSLRGAKTQALAREFPLGALMAIGPMVSEAEREIQFNANLGQCALALALKIREEKEKWQKLS